MIKIFTDGGSRGNPGKSACAFVVYEDDVEVHSESKYLGINTNNYAEYSGVLIALKYLVHSTQYLETHFFLDSELVVKQLNGIYKIKNIELQKLAIEIKKTILEKKLNVSFQNIPREKNKRADELVNIELDNN